MRIAICALSAVLLSGCSWMGMGGAPHHGGKYKASSHHGAQHGAYGAQARRGHNPCQIMAPTQPVPRGCAPHQVTVAAPGAHGGFPQQPQFGGGNYATGGYGSHAGNAAQHASLQQRGPRLRKPKLRAQMSMGFEKSVSGDYLKTVDNPLVLPYNPDDFAEGRTTGSVASGNITTETFTAIEENRFAPDISFDDVHSTPFRLAGGLEYIASPKTTFFANAGYSYAEGEDESGVGITGELRNIVTSQDYDDMGAPVGGPITNIGFVPNQNIANFRFDHSDMTRIDLELGARHYLSPIMKTHVNRTVTPYVGVAAGASHYNEQTFTVQQNQLFFERGYNSAVATGSVDQADFYQVTGPAQEVTVYDSQWIPSGAVTAGLEWQMTPKTALAFETGVRVEGGRKYSSGSRSDKNVAIPLTIRGSYNF